MQQNVAKKVLANGLDSLIKSITGNLDIEDALRYNDAIKSLEQYDVKIVFELNNHVSLTKK